MIQGNQKLWFYALAGVLSTAPMFALRAEAAVDFKCPECIDNADLRDGSVDEAKLDSDLLNRLANMEARLSALEGGVGGGSTGFEGTYRCHELIVGQEDGETAAGVLHEVEDFVIQADGAGEASLVYEEKTIPNRSLYWYVVGYVEGDAQRWALESVSNPLDPRDDLSFAYSVTADGEILVEGQKVGYLSESGEVATLQDAWYDLPEDTGTGASEFSVSLAVCVRTSIP